MRPDFILQEKDFCLEFRSINKLISPDEFPQLVDMMTGDDGYVLQERIIMPPHMIGQANDYSAKAVAPLRCNEPLIFIGHPDLPVQYASIIARRGGGKSKIEKSDTAIKITADGINLLYSAPIFNNQGGDGRSFIAAFNKISEVLKSFSMRESAITRTWLFMDNILKDYEKLNTAREQFFAKWHCAANNFLPASTGIQGHTIGNEALAVEFCAFSGDEITIRQISSPLQNEPTDYGKLFSRAVVVGFPKSQLLFISGTAAIDKAGSSVHIRNFESQMAFTLEVVSAILKQENGGFSNVVQAIVYLKRSEDMDSCLRILDGAGFPRARALFQLNVDVCRDNLLCEIEATAVIT
jgi:enamine deaminase RidA (YjgF/YER057c/UK114 family)